MNRKETRDDIFRIIERLRMRVPAIVIRSTFIAGFPGETEADHAALLSDLTALALDRVGSAPLALGLLVRQFLASIGDFPLGIGMPFTPGRQKTSLNIYHHFYIFVIFLRSQDHLLWSYCPFNNYYCHSQSLAHGLKYA